MSFLNNEFRKATSKFKDSAMSAESDISIGYPTTFLPLDYRNGMYVTTEELERDIEYNNYSIGLGEGSIVTIIGKPGSAKTTFAIQAATSIIAPFKDSVIIHDDVEASTVKPRIKNISGWSNKDIYYRYNHRNIGVNAENFFERVSLHCNMKLENAERLSYDTGLKDMFGKPVYRLIPSVYILDSLALLMPKDFTEEEKLKGQMLATAQAKTNAQIFKRLGPLVKQANVILIVINHINENVNINPYAGKSAQINYLGQDETVPGGRMALYLSNNIIKFTTSKKLTDDKEYGINGFRTKVTLIKSRTNRAGQQFEMVYNQNYGFDRILTLYETLKNVDMVRGAGSSFYLDGCEHIKFPQKRFLEKFHNEPKLRECMRDLSTSYLQNLVPKYEEEDSSVLTLNDVMKRLQNSMTEDLKSL